MSYPQNRGLVASHTFETGSYPDVTIYDLQDRLQSCTPTALQPAQLAIDITVSKDCAEDDVRACSQASMIADESGNGHNMQPA